MFTHEQYVERVAAAAIARLTKEEQAKLADLKLVYGAGQAGLRGVTYFNRWDRDGKLAPFVEVCAFGQESPTQLAGTTIHELGHALAGWDAGHGKAWKEACCRLGLRTAKAAGMVYRMAAFSTDIRHTLAALPKPTDGTPKPLDGIGLGWTKTGAAMAMPKPCNAGIGTRGGKSRGVGSGSRLRLWECECVPVFKVRAARDIDATCNCCNALFHRV